MISVIVTIYNVKPYLEECLESIINQTFRELEILLIDDGSTDGCYEICEEYQKRDSRIKVLHKPNQGLVNARKDGLKMAEGTYISYIDGDDWVEPDMLETLYSIMEREKTDIVMCGHYEDIGIVKRAVYHALEEGRYDKERMRQSIYPGMIVNGEFFEWGVFPGVWDKLFRRECLEPYQMAVDNRLTMGEDVACFYPCILNAGSVYVLRECFYHYRQTPASMVKKIEDAKQERERFQLLYQSVYAGFERYAEIYDFREQWIEYMLFLMTPRADTLYEGVEKLDYLFPFPKVKKGCRIILYCAGTYGQRLYQYLKRTGFCSVAAWADRNYVELRKQGFDIIDPDEIKKYEFDEIVVASSFAKARRSIYQDLIQQYPEEKVHIMDEKLIKSKETLKAFRLAELQ